jgi:hypothetical protein
MHVFQYFVLTFKKSKVIEKNKVQHVNLRFYEKFEKLQQRFSQQITQNLNTQYSHAVVLVTTVIVVGAQVKYSIRILHVS